MEELIAANEKKRAYFKEQEEHLKRQMEETESLVEYREYLQYQKLYDELLAAIEANGQTDEELTKTALCTGSGDCATACTEKECCR